MIAEMVLAELASVVTEIDVSGGVCKGELTPAQFELRDRFSEGLACYRSRRWDEARRAFDAALAIVPTDGLSTAYIHHFSRLTVDPPAEVWDDSWRLGRK